MIPRGATWPGPLWSCGCRELTWLKQGGCQVSISSQRVAVTVLNVNILDQDVSNSWMFSDYFNGSQNYTLVGSHVIKRRN